MENYIVRKENDWAEATVELLRRWERDCQFRKKAHYKAANSFGWKNKLFSIPVIVISTILGSLSFIHPSFTGSSAPIDCASPSRMLQSISPTSSPTTECIWENFNSDNLITEPPYCDNSIIKYQNSYYKSTISEIDELVCDRDVNFVASTLYNQFPVAAGITTQADAEAWCVEQDEGYGIFYQKWVDGQIICMILAESPDSVVLHGFHLFGGVCISSGILDNPTQTYINNCGGEDQTVVDIYNGNCALITDCTDSCPGIVGGYDLQTIGFFDCGCCYDYWTGCSWGECSGLVGSSPPPTPTIHLTDSPVFSPTPSPTKVPTYAPTKVPTYAPTKVPTYAPTKVPTYAPTKVPTYAPTKVPTYAPTKVPTYAPTKVPTYAPTKVPTKAPVVSPTNSPTGTENFSYASYIVGAFNMVIAILSALHTFLKYDALEDRHHQYSRHFGNLKLDIETLLCKPKSHRGDSTAIMENFKTKYSVLMNNAPDLPSRLEQNCMDRSCIVTTKPAEIELT